ncbi:hypothetical protein C4559_00340 [Candidatus Microgenomates bacterium]|nr:MAG: hypothetical protein C4559_00340 [Candidatus Microgenomates bacterium]
MRSEKHYPYQLGFKELKAAFAKDVERVLGGSILDEKLEVIFPETVRVNPGAIIFPYPWPRTRGKVIGVLTAVVNEKLMGELGWESKEFKIYQADNGVKLSEVEIKKRRKRGFVGKSKVRRIWELKAGSNFMAKPQDTVPLNGKKL